MQSQKSIDTAIKARDEIVDILSDKSDKMFVVVGPCSIHDLLAAREYGKELIDRNPPIAKPSLNSIII
jgi:3-deoxy-7-phosphoheptulonate synthase